MTCPTNRQFSLAAFDNLKIGLGSIATNLDTAKGFVSEEATRRRRSAKESLESARKMWIKVNDLATRFQSTGLVREKAVESLSTDEPDNP